MRKRFLVVLAIVLSPVILVAQELDEFKKYYSESVKEFKDARAKANAEFVDFLSKAWEEFTISREKIDPIGLLPDKPTYYNKAEHDNSLKHGIPSGYFALPATKPATIPAIAAYPYNVDYIRVDFFGIPEQIPFSSDMRISKVKAQESSVSEGWKKLSNSDFESTTDVLTSLKKELSLSDWAIYTTIRKITDAVYVEENVNEKVLTQMFLLSQMGYRARVGSSGEELILLLPFDSPVYQVSYISDDGWDYYIYSYSRLNPNNPLYTFGEDFSMAEQPISLVMRHGLSVGYDFYQLKQMKLWEPIVGDEVLAPINIPHVQFTLDYPQSDLMTYHKSAVDSELQKAIFKTLRYKIIKDQMNPEQAVSFIMNLIQHGFEYKTDYEMFGRAKPLFIEESFFYGSNNCKDRVLIFSWIVRDLLGLDVVMFTYPGHVACGVNLGDNVSGNYFEFEGAKYMMCDPTYIGAPIGATMPKYRNVTPEIVKL